MKLSHEQIETNPWLMIVLIVLVVSVGGLVQIVPLFFQRSTTEPLPGMTPPSALQASQDATCGAGRGLLAGVVGEDEGLELIGRQKTMLH